MFSLSLSSRDIDLVMNKKYYIKTGWIHVFLPSLDINSLIKSYKNQPIRQIDQLEGFSYRQRLALFWSGLKFHNKDCLSLASRKIKRLMAGCFFNPNLWWGLNISTLFLFENNRESRFLGFFSMINSLFCCEFNS